MRRYKLVSKFRLAGDDAVYLVVNMNFIHEIFANVVQEFMQIRVVVVDVARIWRIVAIFLQYGEGDTAVDAQRVDGNETLVARFLLDYRELPIAEVLRTDAHKVAVSLTEITSEHEHITNTLQCLNLIFA